MKKIFSIVLALGLVLGLTIVAAPVAADVSVPQVSLSEDAAGLKAQYTIEFTVTEALSAGVHDIVVDFPDDTGVPGSFADDDITVQGSGVDGDDVSVSGDVVTIVTPVDIAATTTVTVVFELDADIVNPTVGGKYTLFVNTSRAGDMTPVESAEYTIIPAISTYKFVLDFGVDPSAGEPWSGEEMSYQNIAEDCIPPLRKGEETAFNCTLKTDVEGAAGYDLVLIKFTLDSAPEDATVTLRLYEPASTTWYLFELTADDPSGYWGPPEGFELTADYDETTPATVTCDKPGDYTVTWAVVDMEDDEAVVPSARTVTATVYEDFKAYDIVLDEGWNLMSLPLIPLDPAIETVLCGLNVTSVWYWDTGILDWLTYEPDGPSDLDTMEDGKAYWINMPDAGTLWVFGTKQAVPPALPAAYDVVVGWNMIGFKSIETDIKAQDYLTAGNEWVRIYTYDDGWAIVQDDDMMEPGLGYWVAFTAAGTIYP